MSETTPAVHAVHAVRAVRAANALAVRWAAAARTQGGTVFSAAGVWPLLALLAAGAHGDARTELEQALGVPAEAATAHARELFSVLDTTAGTEAALGLWFRDSIEPTPAWAAELPPRTTGRLSADHAADRARLDAWAADRTGGLIRSMPVEPHDRTLLLLASALTVRTEWAQPFDPHPLTPRSGPWRGRNLAGLDLTCRLADQAAVTEAPGGRVTEARVEGRHGIDVHLLLGEEAMSPAEVLGAGVGLLHGSLPRTSARTLPLGHEGPGITVTEWPYTDSGPWLTLSTPAFTVAGEHDLLAHAEVFGLVTAMDVDGSHFCGITRSEPLAVDTAKQSAVATFGSTGFRAAAVTAVAARLGGAAARPLQPERTVHVCLDRPFGFLAVHRATGLVLTAGWVTEPDPAPARPALTAGRLLRPRTPAHPGTSAPRPTMAGSVAAPRVGPRTGAPWPSPAAPGAALRLVPRPPADRRPPAG